jgi:large subunit ribosomal protein L32
MAALPKKKVSKVRGKTRRAHNKAVLPQVITDRSTGKARLSHQVDLTTGLYRGRIVMKTKLAARVHKATGGATQKVDKPAKPVDKKPTRQKKSDDTPSK